MGDRITAKNVDAAFERYAKALKLANLDAFSDVSLSHGSKPNGVAFMVWRKTPNGEKRYALGSHSGFVGWTRREAYETLMTLARAYEDVAIYATEEI